MELNYLKNFYELVLAGSVRSLAEINNVPQATISRQLRNLEHDVGHPLLERKQGLKGLKLTRQGKVLFDMLPSILGALDNAMIMMESDPGLNKGEVTIYATTSLIEYWFVPMLSSFFEKYPFIHLNFVSHDYLMSDEMQARVISISPKHKEKVENMTQIPLLDFHVGLWASPAYLERYGRPKTLTDLMRHRLIVYTKELDRMVHAGINWHLKDLSIKREDLLCINSSSGCIKAAYNGLGVISLSAEAVQASGYSLERVLPDIRGPVFTMCLTYPSYMKGNQLIKNVEEFLQDYFPAYFKKIRGNSLPLLITTKKEKEKEKVK